MGSLVNSSKHFRKKLYQLSTTFFRGQKQREFLTHSMRQHYYNIKTKDITRKKKQLVTTLKLHNIYNTNIVKNGICTPRLWPLNKSMVTEHLLIFLEHFALRILPYLSFKTYRIMQVGKTIPILQLMKLDPKKVKDFPRRPLQLGRRVRICV